MAATNLHGPTLDLAHIAPVLSSLGLELGNVVALTVTPYTWAAAVLLTDDQGHPVMTDGPNGEAEAVLTTRYGSCIR